MICVIEIIWTLSCLVLTSSHNNVTNVLNVWAKSNHDKKLTKYSQTFFSSIVYPSSLKLQKASNFLWEGDNKGASVNTEIHVKTNTKLKCFKMIKVSLTIWRSSLNLSKLTRSRSL